MTLSIQITPNIGGRAITLTGRLQGNLFFTSFTALSGQIDLSGLALYKQMGFRANLSLDARSVLPAHIGLRLDLIGERVFRTQFRFTRVAALSPSVWWGRKAILNTIRESRSRPKSNASKESIARCRKNL